MKLAVLPTKSMRLLVENRERMFHFELSCSVGPESIAVWNLAHGLGFSNESSLKSKICFIWSFEIVKLLFF